MDPIQRPDNVHVPRALQRRIEARRALQEGTSVEDMRSALKHLGEPTGGNKEELTERLTEIARGGSAINLAPTAAAATPKTGGARAVAAPANPKGGE